jgi:hypothetical protein
VDFTREPIIETVVTPKEGHKLVIRNSKAAGQEEFFVDAVEIVSFNQALFFRSVEKPKAFLVPTNDYEVLEVREARMVLKHVGLERAIKIGGGKEHPPARNRENIERENPVLPPPVATPAEAAIAAPVDAPVTDDKNEGRFERKRERRRHYRRRRGRDEAARDENWTEGEGEEEVTAVEEELMEVVAKPAVEEESSARDTLTTSYSILSSLLPPPPNLISETIARYRENDMFKDAFFLKEPPVGSTPEEANTAIEKEKACIATEKKEASTEDMPCEKQQVEEAHVTTVADTESPVFIENTSNSVDEDTNKDTVEGISNDFVEETSKDTAESSITEIFFFHDPSHNVEDMPTSSSSADENQDPHPNNQ